MRINGCQPSETILAESQGAYKPRSLITITVQCSGTLSANDASRPNQCGSQEPFSSAPTTFHDTAMAQPRYTTLITNTVKRFFKVVASKARARRGSSAGHQARIHFSNGAKHVLTSSSRRLSPFLSLAPEHHSRKRCTKLASEQPNCKASTAHTSVMPHDLASTMPELQ